MRRPVPRSGDPSAPKSKTGSKPGRARSRPRRSGRLRTGSSASTSEPPRATLASGTWWVRWSSRARWRRAPLSSQALRAVRTDTRCDRSRWSISLDRRAADQARPRCRAGGRDATGRCQGRCRLAGVQAATTSEAWSGARCRGAMVMGRGSGPAWPTAPGDVAGRPRGQIAAARGPRGDGRCEGRGRPERVAAVAVPVVVPVNPSLSPGRAGFEGVESANGSLHPYLAVRKSGTDYGLLSLTRGRLIDVATPRRFRFARIVAPCLGPPLSERGVTSSRVMPSRTQVRSIRIAASSADRAGHRREVPAPQRARRGRRLP